MKTLTLMLAWLAAITVFESLSLRPALAAPPAEAAAKPFTDITKESGAGDALDQHYKNEPKLWLSGMDLIDLDGDGHLDLFLGSHGQKSGVALGDGKGHFTYVDPMIDIAREGRSDVPYPGSEYYIAYDLNEDGLLDLLCTYRDGGGMWWMNQSRPGKLSFKPTKYQFGGCRINCMVDLDRDGKVDWITMSGEGKKVSGFRLFRGKGDGTFAEPAVVGDASVSVGRPIDLNGDGFMDMIFSGGSYDFKDGKRGILLNDGKGNLVNRTEECGLTGDGTINVVGDLNGDGFPDLICLEHHSQFVVMLNDGKGHFTEKEDVLHGLGQGRKPAYGDWGQGVVFDIDNDGVPDIIMNGKNFLYVLRGTGDGHFEYMNKKWGISEIASAALNEGMCFGDVDEDGMLDLVTCAGDVDKNRRIAVYRNDLPRLNWVRVRPVGLAGNRAAGGAKIRVYEKGGLGDDKKLLWYEQVSLWSRQSSHNYYMPTQTERHFGLGQREGVDISVEFYPSGKKVEAKGIKADRIVTVEEENGKVSEKKLGEGK